jgi:outer membrane protein TolC
MPATTTQDTTQTELAKTTSDDMFTTPAELPAVLSLRKALEIAVTNSRQYQSEKENIYLQALYLSLARHRWAPRFGWVFGAIWNRYPVDIENAEGELDLDYERTVTYTSNLSFNQLLADGGSVAVDLATDFFRYVSDDPQETAASLLSVQVIQPLLRGAGRKVAQENLTQSERDMIYQLRDFARFRKTYAVSIANLFYRVLERRAIVRNEWNNYQNLILGRERAELMAKAGRLPEFQVDQARQDELRARDRWISAMENYEGVLDDFKIELGLPTDALVELNEREMQLLLQTGIVHPDIAENEAVKTALDKRLDLLTAKDRFADAERKVHVAKNDLLPYAELQFNYDVDTEPPRRYDNFRWDRESYSASADLELPLDRKAERNAYRQSLINADRASRNASLREDRVKQEVRLAWRGLQQAKESYQIQKRSLELAERRVESVSLLLQAGRASTRDLLEAQEALVNAQNSLLGALVDHTIARLELLRDMESLRITDKGIWEEQNYGASQQDKENSGS